MLVLQDSQFGFFRQLPARLAEWGDKHGVKVLIIIVAGVLFVWLVRLATTRLARYVKDDGRESHAARLQRAHTLSSILNSVVRVGVISIVIMVVLDTVGLNIAPILAGAGVVGLAIGFGAQSLVRDVLGGFFIVFEDQFGIGDAVTIGDTSGTVERMTLRITVLRDLEGRLHYIPNGTITKVTVGSKDWSAAFVDVNIAYQTHFDQALATLERVSAELAEDLPNMIIDQPKVLGIQSFADNGITVRTSFKTRPTKQLEVAREFRRRVRDEFGRTGLALSGWQTNLVRNPEAEVRSPDPGSLPETT